MLSTNVQEYGNGTLRRKGEIINCPVVSKSSDFTGLNWLPFLSEQGKGILLCVYYSHCLERWKEQKRQQKVTVTWEVVIVEGSRYWVCSLVA